MAGKRGSFAHVHSHSGLYATTIPVLQTGITNLQGEIASAVMDGIRQHLE